MKKKSNKLIWVIVALIIAFGLMIYFYMKPASSANNATSDGTTGEANVSRQTITKSISSSRRNIFSRNRELRIKYC